MKTLGKEVDDLGPALRKGVEVLEVMKIIGKAPAPFFAKRPTVMQQEVDNWHVVIKYMKCVGVTRAAVAKREQREKTRENEGRGRER